MTDLADAFGMQWIDHSEVGRSLDILVRGDDVVVLYRGEVMIDAVHVHGSRVRHMMFLGGHELADELDAIARGERMPPTP